MHSSPQPARYFIRARQTSPFASCHARARYATPSRTFVSGSNKACDLALVAEQGCSLRPDLHEPDFARLPTTLGL